MKSFKLFSFFAICLGMTTLTFAQDLKTETIPVSGNCGMCKSNIEKAAKKAGAAEAAWSVEGKTLTVKYSSTSTNTAKIQQSVAAAGYDTRDVKAVDAAYDKLHACCKYDRSAAKSDDKCCADKCMKDGKCDMTACKDKGCCTDEAACKEKGCCSSDKTAGMGACCKKS